MPRVLSFLTALYDWASKTPIRGVLVGRRDASRRDNSGLRLELAGVLDVLGIDGLIHLRIYEQSNVTMTLYKLS